MLEVYNFTIAGIGNVPVAASSWKEAEEIIQDYLDKHSLDYTYSYA